MSRGRRGARLVAAAGSWWVALRIARREARRARGRTALVLAMIALPVLVLSFAATTWDMSNLTRPERAARQLGAADAELLPVARNPVTQAPWGDGWGQRGDDLVPPGRVTAEQVTGLLPPGARVLPILRWAFFEARVGDRVEDGVSGRVVDLTDPLGRGLARVHAGRAPAVPGEIAANPAALRRLDTRLGGTVTSADGRRTWTVVGVVEFPDQLSPLVVLPPGPQVDEEATWLVDLPGAVGEDLIRRLNEHGYVVQARVPGPPTEDGRTPGGISRIASVDVADASGIVLVGGLALLEVVLLVGPAFAVGVRRRRRDLALVAVAGGDDAHLRRIVLADGIVLGAVGAGGGLALGVAAAVAARPLVEEYVFGERFGGYRTPPALLLAIAAVAVLAGVLAALVPAWTAARQDVVAGLAGRRTPPAYRRRWLIAGVTLTAAGAVLAATGAVVWTHPTVILAGLVLGELGLVLATPTLVGLLARVGRVLPLAPRIALRDASRNRSSAAPAISAVMAAVAGSVALGVYLASDEARSNQSWRPALPAGTLLVTRVESPEQAATRVTGPDGAVGPLESAVAAAARTHLNGRQLAPLVEVGCAAAADPCQVAPVLPPDRACPWPAGGGLTEADQRRARADERCRRGPEDPWGPHVVVTVDDGRTLPLLTDATAAEAAEAAAVLRAGGAVVTDPRYLVDGRLEIVVRDGADAAVSTRATVPGYALRTHRLAMDRLLLSPGATTHLGVTAQPVGWAFATEHAADRDRRDRFVAALRPHGTVSVGYEEGPPASDTRPLLLLLAAASGVITLGAAGVATGLAAAEGRADLSTLAAVGAPPAVRRILSLCQAGVIAVLGSALGIVAGLGSALMILIATNRRYTDSWPVGEPYPLVVPGTTLAVLVVVPLVAMLGAGLFTRSRLPVERRLD
ncbi:FtsX-like permease family protein [Micromonospora sp. NPDC047707]|uniref:FtsX-like permease family protein n=1 Tax=unclassified Micromonospora TaxID=2617518 RepID=UPI0012B4D0C3|nr:FtsX-like permease family protein [Micromonospora sp. WMMC415]QGN50175.1 FtsX-like permease family protein [Micromonospora sp. WMMC415]